MKNLKSLNRPFMQKLGPNVGKQRVFEKQKHSSSPEQLKIERRKSRRNHPRNSFLGDFNTKNDVDDVAASFDRQIKESMDIAKNHLNMVRHLIEQKMQSRKI